MKTIIRNSLLGLLSFLTVTACEKDEDKLYLNSIEPGQLIASEENIVLTQEHSDEIVLSLAWSTDNLVVSDPDLTAPGGQLSMTLEASADENFSSIVETTETSYSKAYTGATLNALAQSVGAQPDVAANIYFRLAARSGANMEPVYTNAVAVSVTPYLIDMSRLFVLDSSQAPTGMSLYSPQSDGHYEGFLGVTGWYNFYLQEGDGTVWGAAPIDGNPFTLSEAENKWNSWFPNPAGCYYVVADVNELYWTALSLHALNLTGDIAEEHEGRWYIRGRSKDVIISSDGENVYPDEIEHYFKDVPHVRNAVAFGAEEGNREKIVLIVETDVQPDEEGLESLGKALEEINQGLEGSRKVSEMAVAIDPLPLANSMKVKRGAVKEDYLAHPEKFLYFDGRKIAPRETVSFDGFPEDEVKEMLGLVRDCFAENLSLPASRIGDDDIWNQELGGDSMSYVSMIADLDEKTGLDIPRESYGKVGTVRGFALLLLQLRHGSPAPVAHEDKQE